MRMTFDPGVGRMSSINRVIRWVCSAGGAGVAGFMTEAILPVCCSTGAIASVFCSAESGSSVGSDSSLVSNVTYFAFRHHPLLLSLYFLCIENALLKHTLFIVVCRISVRFSLSITFR
jgi:hypothetical protein